MKIGIDISQIAHEGTGVANYVKNLVENLLSVDDENEYILFYSSLRKKMESAKLQVRNDNAKFKIKSFIIPPTVLDILWNRLHIAPVEWFIGDVDVFITSDWTDPPTRKAKKITILYDLIVFKYPQETDQRIIATQKRKLNWVKKESNKILCISEATKRDAKELLGLAEDRLPVIYPGGEL